MSERKEFVTLEKEEFSMQRAYLFGLTIRTDVSRDAKIIIMKIEERLSALAEVKSHFAGHKENQQQPIEEPK